MFTGIVHSVGRIADLEKSPEQLRISIDSSFRGVALGESIAVNGVCLTVTEYSADGKLYFYVSRETLDRTNLGAAELGTEVNLERALLATDRLSGHIVQGHVDGLARLLEIRTVGESRELRFALANGLSRYCVEKGSIALNGVSLTINSVRDDEASFMIIPHTWENTNLSSLALDSTANVEIDILAKYAEKLLSHRSTHV